MDASFDRVVIGGRVVTADGVQEIEIGVKGGKITAIGSGLEREGAEIVDARGKIVMPGGVDVHVHLNEPGLGHWEGFAAGTASLAAGGTTTYFDMPLNGRPPTVTERNFRLKRELADGNNVVDYGLWGGLMPGYIGSLEELAEVGVVGFKAFMSATGTTEPDDFREVDDESLLLGMREIARLGGILALHAEDEALVSRLAAESQAAGLTGPYDFSASRPIEAEVNAVRKALSYGAETGCRLHFVHMSSAAALGIIQEAKQRGMDVSSEVCAHHLLLTEDDLAAIGPAAKCAPPLRDPGEVERIWGSLVRGEIDMIASDHSPSPLYMKEGVDFFAAWGGISGAQHRMELIIDEAHLRRGIPLHRIAEWLSSNPAQRFGVADRKGRIAVGLDADFVLFAMGEERVIMKNELLYAHPHSPYTGRKVACRVEATYCRGELVYDVARGIVSPGNGVYVSGMSGTAGHGERVAG